jgi:hypothetical protein
MLLFLLLVPCSPSKQVEKASITPIKKTSEKTFKPSKSIIQVPTDFPLDYVVNKWDPSAFKAQYVIL